jgi:hypothetical protein
LAGCGRARSSEGAVVAYSLRLAEPVWAYLRTLGGLTREGRLRLLAGVLGLLRDHGDVLRSDPSRRLASGSPYFRFDYVFSDAGRLWRVDCVADDSAAAYGLLGLVYLDCQPGTCLLSTAQ